jgi:hypothetical protein
MGASLDEKSCLIIELESAFGSDLIMPSERSERRLSKWWHMQDELSHMHGGMSLLPECS